MARYLRRGRQPLTRHTWLEEGFRHDSSEPRYIETIPKRGYRFVAPVTGSQAKISQAAPAQLGFSDIACDALVIEKHTFTRVISDEFEPNDFDEAEVPAEHTPSWPASGAQALTPVIVTNRRKKRWIVAGVVAGVLVASAIAALVYVKRGPVSAPPVTRSKSTLVRLTNNNAMDCEPVWSPDGNRMAFWSNRDGGKEIYVMDADGSNVKRLTNNLSDDVNPSWSPDGHRLLFESERDGNREIYVMDADGGNQIRLTRDNAADSTAAWSPDGSLIAFASNRNSGYPHNPYNMDIYVMNADGSNVRTIVDDHHDSRKH